MYNIYEGGILLFKDELKRLREQRGLSQAKLAELLNLSASTIGMYETGEREPRNIETLELIADFFNVNLDRLTKGSLSPTKIPVLGSVVAGIPLEAITDIVDYEEISPSMASTGEFFALRVKGDSMLPRFTEGDIVIVRKQEDIDSGDIAIMLVNGDEATIKKVQKFENGINLIPSNPAYDVMTFTKKEIISLPVVCLGKVVELRAKF